MPNSLTGDFDLVAQFSVSTVNRVLAAMHSNGRFLHSIAARIDDNPPPGTVVTRPTMVGSVDTFGDPIVNHGRIGKPDPFPGALAATSAINADLDQLVNVDTLVATTGDIVPSKLQGRLQAQLFPPTIGVPDASGTNLIVAIGMMSRYFPDKDTAPLAEFVRGILHITASVTDVSSQTANVVEIDFKADQAIIDFTPTF